MTIQLPMKAYLIKYLKEKFSIEQHYKMTLTDPLGIILFGYLKYPPRYWRESLCNSAHLTVDVSRLGDYRRIYLSTRAILLINQHFDLLFRQDLYKYVDDGKKNGKEIKQCILEFLDEFDIYEGYLSFQTVERGYFRFKKSGKIRVYVSLKKVMNELSVDLSV